MSIIRRPRPSPPPRSREAVEADITEALDTARMWDATPGDEAPALAAAARGRMDRGLDEWPLVQASGVDR